MEIYRIAKEQHGVISRRQALALGMSKSALDRGLRRGEWEKVACGVYRHSGAPESWRQTLMAGTLCLPWPALVSHRSAAALWEIDGFKPGLIELTCGLGSAHEPDVSWILHRTDRVESQVTHIEGIPVTTPERTLLDLGAVIPRWRVAKAVDDCLMKKLVSIQSLQSCLAEVACRGRRGAGILRSLLDERSGLSERQESVLEGKVLRVLEQAGFPRPHAQYEVREGSRVVARIDFAYPAEMVAIEADGYLYHGGKVAWSHDLTRRNALTAMGWRVIHVTWDDLKFRRRTFLAQLRLFLGE